MSRTHVFEERFTERGLPYCGLCGFSKGNRLHTPDAGPGSEPEPSGANRVNDLLATLPAHGRLAETGTGTDPGHRRRGGDVSVRSDMIEAVAKDLITDYPDISPAAWRKMAEDMLALFLPDDEGVPPWMEFADCWDPARGDDSRSGVYYDDEIVPADARPLYRMKP